MNETEWMIPSTAGVEIQTRIADGDIDDEEAERLRIASELHDGIGQILSVIKLGIENLAKGLDGELVQRHQRNFKSLISMTRHAAEEVRRISMDLHPAMLEAIFLMASPQSALQMEET